MLVLISATARADERTQQARTLVQVARARFDQGDFTKAAELLETAYELSPTPEILFNLAKARERAGNLEAAITTLQRYLETAPRATDRKGVEVTIAGLRQRLDEKRQLEALKRGLTEKPVDPVEPKPVEPKPVESKPVESKPVESKPVEPKPVESKPVESKPVESKPVEAKVVEAKVVEPTPESPRARLSPWSFVLGGVGVAGLAVGVGLGLNASDLHRQAQMGLVEVAVGQQRQALTFATGANISFVAAATLMAGGLAWFLVDWLSR